MEPADIDWKNLKWRFVEDDLFEHFNAPKWVDLSVPSPRGVSPSSVPSDEAWFCRPDCRHPKTAEDFLSSRWSPSTSPSKVKLSRAWSSPLGERIHSSSSINGDHRDATLKRRGCAAPPTRDSPRSKLPTAKKKFREDLENQDPNLTPATPFQAAKIAKEAVKSSTERREHLVMPERPLKSTLSARNLFAGKDILTQISDFCNEIKRLAMPKSDNSRSLGGDEDKNRKAKEEFGLSEKERKPLLAFGEDGENSKTKQETDAGKVELEKQRLPPDPKKKARSQNSPPLKVLENLRMLPEPKKKARENSPLLQEVRSCPPTPQRFPSPKSLRRKPITIPIKSSLKPGVPERGVLGELGEHHSREEEAQALVEIHDGNNIMSTSPVNADSRSVDLFWFFKPCTYLGGR